MTKAEKAHLDAVARCGCVACQIDGYLHSPAEIHHCRIVGGKRDLSPVLPLCFYHHRGNAAGIPSIHAAKTAFRARYGTEEALLEIVEGKITALSANTIGG